MDPVDRAHKTVRIFLLLAIAAMLLFIFLIAYYGSDGCGRPAEPVKIRFLLFCVRV